MKLKNKNIFGFTLVELLVVISIIGILTMIGAVAYSGAQRKARDTQRKTELDALSKALIMYYNDHGVFPALDSGSFFSSTVLTGGDDKRDIVYLAKMPEDPKNTGDFIYVYKYDKTTNKQFNIFANLENKGDSQCDGNWSVVGVGVTFCYGVSSPNLTLRDWGSGE